MDLWTVLEERIKKHGVRVDERVELLAALKADHESGTTSVADRKEALVHRVEDRAALLKEKLRS